MKLRILIIFLILFFSLNVRSECNNVTIAKMDWASAEIFAHIDNIILENGYGCEVELVPGATIPTATSMIENGKLDIAPELWINAFRTNLNKAVSNGKIHYGAEIFSDTGEEGWWIPHNTLLMQIQTFKL